MALDPSEAVNGSLTSGGRIVARIPSDIGALVAVENGGSLSLHVEANFLAENDPVDESETGNVESESEDI